MGHKALFCATKTLFTMTDNTARHHVDPPSTRVTGRTPVVQLDRGPQITAGTSPIELYECFLWAGGGERVFA